MNDRPAEDDLPRPEPVDTPPPREATPPSLDTAAEETAPAERPGPAAAARAREAAPPLLESAAQSPPTQAVREAPEAPQAPDEAPGERTPHRPPDLQASDQEVPNRDSDAGEATSFRDVQEPPSLSDRLQTHLDNSDVTPAGRSFYEPNDTEMRESAQTVEEIPGHYALDMHGDAHVVVIGDDELSADELGQMLERDANYAGQPITLVSCETGQVDDGFAQQMADRMDVAVTGPTGLAWVDGDGRVHSTDRGDFDEYGVPGPDSEWITYYPRNDDERNG